MYTLKIQHLLRITLSIYQLTDKQRRKIKKLISSKPNVDI